MCAQCSGRCKCWGHRKKIRKDGTRPGQNCKAIKDPILAITVKVHTHLYIKGPNFKTAMLPFSQLHARMNPLHLQEMLWSTFYPSWYQNWRKSFSVFVSPWPLWNVTVYVSPVSLHSHQVCGASQAPSPSRCPKQGKKGWTHSLLSLESLYM